MTFQRKYKSLSLCSFKTQEKHFIDYLLMYDRMEEFEMVEYYVEELNKLYKGSR